MRKLCVIVLSALIITGCTDSDSTNKKSSSDPVESTMSSTATSLGTDGKTSLSNKETEKSEQIGSQNDYKDLIIGCWKETQGVFTDNSGYIKFGESGNTINPFIEQNDGTYSIEGDTIIIGSKPYNIIKITPDSMYLEKNDDSNRTMLVFVRQTPNAEENNMGLLQTVNSKAKLIFTTLENTAADLISDGESVEEVKTDSVVAIDSFRFSNNPLEKAVYNVFEDNWGSRGYVYIRFDPNNENEQNYVQWSNTKDGDVVGQYPDPPKSLDADIQFGTKNK